MWTSTHWLDGKKFETIARTHRILSDQPVLEGGGDAGMTPPELLLASLGSCAGHYAAEYLRARNLPVADLEVRVSAEKGTRPTRLARFRIEVDVPDIEEKHREGLLRAVKACLIHNTLATLPAIEVTIGEPSRGVMMNLREDRYL
jgi:uncharacterized OsmC-like protein